ncbi:MAG: TRAP transporter large permease subunit [Gammaproteobacteria bacterium]|nr:TRAP transporter large permease subunit [Gammaproteobacteria bacterium]
MIVPLVLLVLILLGTPLFAVISAGAIAGFLQSDIPLTVIPIEIYGIAETPILLAIPLFTFAGYVMAESRAPLRLVRLTTALVGWVPGGVAIVSIAACAIFTAFTGGSGVTIIALGAALLPALTKAGYDERFSLGLITSAGCLGLLFAPSLPLILFGVITETSIDDMFVAGLLPGLLMMAGLGTYCLWVNRHVRVPLSEFSWGEVRAAVRESWLDIPLPLVVLGGIYGGFFAVSEAAAVTAVYAVITEVFVHRDIALSQLPQIMRRSMVLVGAILLILGVSLASTNVLIDAQVPQKLVGVVTDWVGGPISFLVLLFVFLLALGAVLDIFSALVLVVPLMIPVAEQYQVNPVHLGILFVANMELGYLAPPMGRNLVVASYRFDRPILEIYRATLPFLLVLLVTVLVVTFWPGLSLWLLGADQ